MRTVPKEQQGIQPGKCLDTNLKGQVTVRNGALVPASSTKEAKLALHSA